VHRSQGEAAARCASVHFGDEQAIASRPGLEDLVSGEQAAVAVTPDDEIERAVVGVDDGISENSGKPDATVSKENGEPSGWRETESMKPG